jgi:phosphoglycolate phosphatase-like HAD superfamily hydrolase
MITMKTIGILKPRATIIFDLDGTLVEMIPKHAIMLFCNFIQSLGLTSSLEEAKECYSKGYNKWCKIKDTLNGRRKYLKLWELCFSSTTNNDGINPIKLAYTYQKIHEENCLDILYLDVIPTLQALHGRFKLGIFSERTSTAIRNCLDRHNLHGYFDFYISASDIDSVNAKFSDKAWLALIEKINECEWIDGYSNPNLKNEVLYIGDDYLTDIVNGYKHGIPSVLIDRKHKYTNSKAELVKITSLNELMSWMDKWINT